MTSDQATIVRASWPVVDARVSNLAANFYVHLFEIDPSAAELFARVDLAEQRKKLVHTLTTVVRGLDDPDRLLETLSGLAKRHARYGVELRHFESVGDALLWALADSLGPQFTSEVRAAWTEAYALIASVMKRAIERSAVRAV